MYLSHRLNLSATDALATPLAMTLAEFSQNSEYSSFNSRWVKDGMIVSIDGKYTVAYSYSVVL